MARRGSDPRARPRVPLSRERALAAAVRIADEAGLGALTMRRLAEALGVEAMSLYHHVANKDEILDGMVDLVFGEIALPPRGIGWRGAMRRRAVAAREALLRHSWAIGLMESRRHPGPATLRYHDASIGHLRAAGFPVSMAAHALVVLDSYVFGFVLRELNLPYDSADDLEEMAGTLFRDLPPASYPHFTELVVEHALQPGYSFAKEFAFGLGLILDGLESKARRP